LSRMLKYDQDGGHSLEAWGKRLGLHKEEFNDFSKLSTEMVGYCRQDVAVTKKLYEFFGRFWKSPAWQEAILNEHRAARIAYDLEAEGFGFNATRAKELREELATILEVLDSDIKAGFPPRAKLVREITPRVTKHGTLNAGDFRWLGDTRDLSPFRPEAPFSL